MFAGLSEKLQGAVQKLRGEASLSEENIKDALRDVRLALLEADVELGIVREFVQSVKAKALGMEVPKGVGPAEVFLQFVHDELVELMGGEPMPPKFDKGRLNRVMMVGLQGSGKTTTAGKIALKFKDLKPTLAACDIYRPAAIEQLRVVASKTGSSFYEKGTANPVQTAKEAVDKAREDGSSLVIVDTAGRLQIDEELMSELEKMKAAVDPHEVLLVVDAMTGQEAVKVARTFHERIGITGVVLTKIDGDARGGAALSVLKAVGQPIRFLGVGEKLDGIELFDARRMASRILGMGDVFGLAEKASNIMDEATAKKMQRRMSSGEFNLVDFLNQLEMISKMGPLEDLLKMIPGVSGMLGGQDMSKMQSELKRTKAMIQSMTPLEREDPSILNGSRRKRIAKGSGVDVQQINQLIRQFDQMKQAMKQLKKMGLFKASNFMKGNKGPLGF